MPKILTLRLSEIKDGEVKVVEKSIPFDEIKNLDSDDIKDIVYAIFKDLDATLEQVIWQ